MKKLSLLATIFLFTGIIVMDAQTQNKKILVAYFSWSGNTQEVAQMIAKQTDGTLFHIQTITKYPKGYKKCTDVAKQEQIKKTRPKLLCTIPDLKDYDTIFLGYPIWWNDMPMAVYTFLESSDFSGKTIIPFCTHEGSGLSNTIKKISSACPKANVLGGFEMYGNTVQKDKVAEENKIIKWLDTIELK